MKLDYIEAFVHTVDAGSISAAARKLHKSQGTLSVALSNLEIDLGVTLFDRRGHKPVLTDHGKALLEYARSTLSMAETLHKKALGLQQSIEANLTLAVDDCVSPAALSAMLKEILVRFPLLNLELLQPSSPDIPTLIKQKRVQLGISVNQSLLPTEYHARTLGHLQMMVIAAVDHPLADKHQLTLEDMSAHLQIWPASRHSHQPFFYPIISPHCWTVERLSEAVELVEMGIGWSVVPTYLTLKGLRRKKLVMLDHEMSAASQLLPIDIIWDKGLNLGPAAQWIIANAENYINDL